jgi:tetratricopeptide (TPR) repeat protein
MHDSLRVRQRIRRRCAALVLIACAAACEDKKTAAVTPKKPAAQLCKDGAPVDPPKSELRPAIEAFREQRYADAQRMLDELIKKYPSSATVRVWRGDASLFDKALTEPVAAERALPFFAEARRLQDAGCPLRDYEEYYLRLGLTYVYLRRDDPQPALAELEVARGRWPDSAEVFYQSARAYCLLGQVERCADDFEQTLQVAKSLRRPMFLRTHNSLDDWIRRSRTQSEFPALRQSPRYAQIIGQATAGQ